MLYKSGLIFVASPAFASRQQSALRIDTLSSFPFLSFLEDSQRQTWALSGPNAATTTVSFDPVLRSSDFTILIGAAAAGLGIALLPAEVVEDEILPLIPAKAGIHRFCRSAGSPLSRGRAVELDLRPASCA
jgi:DNA-binding transcriptional LysR family regulator